MENRVTGTLVKHALDIAASCGASAVMIAIDAFHETDLPLLTDGTTKIVFITKSDERKAALTKAGRHCVKVPSVPLTRVGQIKIAAFYALSESIILSGDTVVFLTGISGTETLDTLIVSQVSSESEMFQHFPTSDNLPEHVQTEVVERVVNIASELGSEGREGKPVGALFVIGDSANVLSLSKQLILNPFHGYEESQRNILDKAIEETVKGFATIDGAFVVDGDGVIKTCGVFLKTSCMEAELPQGLGARHHVAAGITSVTESIAVTVSESTGTVTIFRDGRVVTEIEKPRRPRMRTDERIRSDATRPRVV